MALVRVLEYASRRLTPAKTCYSNTEQELLAITLALALKFCHDLEFNRFVLYIDHKLLLANFRLKQPSLQTIRLLMKIEGFDYVLQHALGSTMVVADVSWVNMGKTCCGLWALSARFNVGPIQIRLPLVSIAGLTWLHPNLSGIFAQLYLKILL
jgi:hypothetical protein